MKKVDLDLFVFLSRAESTKSNENVSLICWRSKAAHHSTFIFIFDGAMAGRQNKEKVDGLAAQLLLLGAALRCFLSLRSRSSIEFHSSFNLSSLLSFKKSTSLLRIALFDWMFGLLFGLLLWAEPLAGQPAYNPPKFTNTNQTQLHQTLRGKQSAISLIIQLLFALVPHPPSAFILIDSAHSEERKSNQNWIAEWRAALNSSFTYKDNSFHYWFIFISSIISLLSL